MALADTVEEETEVWAKEEQMIWMIRPREVPMMRSGRFRWQGSSSIPVGLR
jgi:hypothetical protein